MHEPPEAPETPAMRNLRNYLSQLAWDLAHRLTDAEVAAIQAQIAAEDKILDRLFGKPIPLDKAHQTGA